MIASEQRKFSDPSATPLTTPLATPLATPLRGQSPPSSAASQAPSRASVDVPQLSVDEFLVGGEATSQSHVLR